MSVPALDNRFVNGTLDAGKRKLDSEHGLLHVFHRHDDAGNDDALGLVVHQTSMSSKQGEPHNSATQLLDTRNAGDIGIVDSDRVADRCVPEHHGPAPYAEAQVGLFQTRLANQSSANKESLPNNGKRYVSKERASKYRDARAIYGCDGHALKEMRAYCRLLVAQGIPYAKTPLGAYQMHQSNARVRGVDWLLTFPQWWAIWVESGRWADRGNGKHCMCRKGDTGAYAVGNVFISTVTDNNRQAHSRLGLPVGVALHAERKPRFTASVRIDGKRHHLGSFPTPELAHAAYLRAVNGGVRA